jgi:hypothetical protein
MKNNISLFVLWLLLYFQTHASHAINDAWILWGGAIGESAEKCITAAELRTWDIHLDDIPCMLSGMINIFMSFAATIAVIFIIVWAYQILFWALEWNKTKGKETITMALWGFALAAFAWLIVKFILTNFS